MGIYRAEHLYLEQLAYAPNIPDRFILAVCICYTMLSPIVSGNIRNSWIRTKLGYDNSKSSHTSHTLSYR